MKFQSVAYWSETLLYMVGFIVFWATIKFIKLLRFNKIMSMFGSTLKYASKPLVSFTFMFAIVFFAFLHFFYLTFMSLLESFSSVVFTAEMMLQMMIGKFDFTEIATASPLLGTLMFFVYMVVVFFIMLTMFVVIVEEAFTAVRDDISKQSNEHEMVEFIMRKFQQWSGISHLVAAMRRKKGGGDPFAGMSEKERLEAKLDQFPESMNRFLDYVHHAYIQKETFGSLFADQPGTGAPSKDSMKAMMQAGAGAKGGPRPSGGKQYRPPGSPQPYHGPDRELTNVD
jgi:polycystin 1L2